MAKPEERKRARELRQEGWAIVDIAKELQLSRNTIRKWVRDIELTDETQKALREKNPNWEAQQKGGQTNKINAYEKRMQYQEAGRQRAKVGSELHLIACILYWAEGAKARTNLNFVNTDANMLKLFIRFLREEMKIENNLIRLKIWHHTIEETEIVRIRQFWLDCLNLPAETHIKMYVKTGTNSRKKRYLNGICAIEVSRVEALQHIYGAIQEYIGFEQPKWGYDG